MKQQSEAQKEARRLYNRFGRVKGTGNPKGAALIAADEKEKTALSWCEAIDHPDKATIRDYYRQIKNEIKKL